MGSVHAAPTCAGHSHFQQEMTLIQTVHHTLKLLQPGESMAQMLRQLRVATTAGGKTKGRYKEETEAYANTLFG